MKRRSLPGWAQALLKLIVSLSNYEFLVGDIEELYNQRLRESGPLVANLKLTGDLISEVQIISGLKRILTTNAMNSGLLYNYFKLSFRNFARYRTFSLTSLIVLVLGFSSVFLIGKFIQYEFSFDQNSKASNTFRVFEEVTNNSGTNRYCTVSAPLGPAILETIPEVKSLGRICKFREIGTYGLTEEQTFKESYLWADHQLLDIMGYDMILGNPNTALVEPRSVVLTQSTARKYFGDANPINQVIIFKTLFYEDVPMTVKGVINDPPSNSHLQFDVLNSFETLRADHFQDIIDNWDINYYYAYLQLNNGASTKIVGAKLDELVARHVNEEDLRNSSYGLQKVSDIYLYPNDNGKDLGPTSDVKYAYFFSLIGLMILVMSGINYTNLSTVRSIRRSREIGIRKAIGATHGGVFWQHIFESLLICSIAVLGAIGVVYLLLPIINQVFDRSMSVDLLSDWILVGGLFMVGGVVGLGAGFYPAVILASLRPASALKTGTQPSVKSSSFRKALIVSQFVASTLILFSSIVVQQQMDYVFEADLGFNKEHLLIMPFGTQEVVQNFELLKTKMEAEPDIISFSAASQYVGSPQLFGEDFDIVHPESGEEIAISSLRFEVGHDLLEVMEARFIAGRNFDLSYPSDRNEAIVVNQSFLKAARMSDAEEIIGQNLKVDFNWGEVRNLKVIGVIADFKMESFHTKVEPAAFYIRPEELYFGHIRIAGPNLQQTLTKIEDIARATVPSIPFDIFFQSDSVDQLYRNDRQFQRLLQYFTFLAVAIACLGLFSFSLFMIKQQTKEIGIRKVLGASSTGIATTLVLTFCKMVLVSLAISLPLSHFLTESWLESFIYRISPSIVTYVSVIGILLVLTLITVLFHSTNAARKNPVDALKLE